MKIIFMLIVASLSSVQNCVSTAPEVTALIGSDVNLSCNFSQCVSGTVDWNGMDTVEWQFESNRSNSSDHIIDHNLEPSWPNVYFKGNLSREACDFSIRLKSAESKHSGTYTCRFRLNMKIYKNSTKVSLRRGPIPRGFDITPLESDDSGATRSPRQMALYCITVLVIMVGVAMVGKWAWKKKTLKSPVVQSSLNTFAPLQGNPNTPEGPEKDASTYVTLQGIKLAPPPTLNVDGIYITMRFNQGDPELPTHVPRKRSGLPTDWMAEETTATSAEETPASPDASTPSQTADGTYATMH